MSFNKFANFLDDIQNPKVGNFDEENAAPPGPGGRETIRDSSFLTPPLLPRCAQPRAALRIHRRRDVKLEPGAVGCDRDFGTVIRVQRDLAGASGEVAEHP